MSHPTRSRSTWLPISLVLLGAVPALGGLVRLASFLPEGPTLPDGVRFADHPGVLAIHIVSALAFALLGALQVWPALRRARPSLHRALGWVLAPAGVIAAITGLVAVLVYEPAPATGPAVTAARVVAGLAMLGSLGAGLAAIARRDLVAHGAWMTRAYAFGVAPGVQALVLAPLAFGLGIDTEATFFAGMVIGWIVSSGVAEWIVRTPRRPAHGARVSAPS